MHGWRLAASEGSSGEVGALQVIPYGAVALKDTERPALEPHGRPYRDSLAAGSRILRFQPEDRERETYSMCAAEWECRSPPSEICL